MNVKQLQYTIHESDTGLYTADGAKDYGEEISKEELLRACLAGKEDAWQHLFEIYGRLIYTVPARFGFSASDCDEIFQEVALQIVDGLSSIQQPERLHSWIVTITRRTCIRRFRQQTNRKTIELDESIPTEPYSLDDTVLPQMQYAEECILLHRAMKKLGNKCQQILTELFLVDEKLSYEEIAERLNIPVGSVGPTRQRCIECLRSKLEKMQEQRNYD